jgi:hypothetical protein
MADIPSGHGPRIALATEEQADSFIARHADAKMAVRTLLRDVKDYRIKLKRAMSNTADASPLRDELRDAETEIDRMSERLPKPDEVVVKKADSDELAKYRALGPVADLEKAKKDATELREKVEKSDRLSVAETAAEALKLPVVPFKTLVADIGLVIEMRDETIDSKVQKVPYVKRASDAKDAPFVKLSEWLKTNPVYAAGLRAQSNGGDQFVQTEGAGLPTAGFEMPASSSTDTAPQSGGVAEKFIADREKAGAARGNPLRPAQASTK